MPGCGGRYNEMSPPSPCAGGGCLLCHYPPPAKTSADIFVSEPELGAGANLGQSTHTVTSLASTLHCIVVMSIAE